MVSIDHLQAALEHVEGATPQEVLDAFLPKKKEIAGLPLVPITMGHSLFLSNYGHPLAKGKLDGWKPDEVGMALYAFTHASKELAERVADGSLEDDLYQFLEKIELGDVPKFTGLLMAHYLNSISTGLEMHDPNSKKKAQKKTRLAGFFQQLRDCVVSITGLLTMLFTIFRKPKG